MAKRPPDKVIEYRISLQDYERDMFNSAIGAYQMNRIATPIINLMNDVTGMVVFLTILAAVGVTGVTFTFLTAMLTTDSSMADVIDAFTTQRQQAIAAGATVGVFGLGSPITAQILSLFGLMPESEGGGGGF
jgi:hypothetical protein